jgi:hypothetical protein
MKFFQKHRQIFCLILSIYVFIQSTFFGGTIAHFLYFLTPPKVNGIQLSFSPYHLIPYFNIVLYAGLTVSGMLFCLASEPFIARRVKNKRIISIPISIIIVPFYFIVIYIITACVKNLLD